MFRALVVDDETLARKEMAILLRIYDDIEIIGEAVTVPQAAQAVADLEPDVVFLDIQLRNESGFDLLELIDTPCAIIFTTAYDEYAIRAFEANAVDYLLKPIEPKRLREAISRLGRGGPETRASGGRLRYSDLVLAKRAGRLRSFRVEDIIMIGAAGDYTRIVTSGDATYLVKSTMKRWLNRLPQDDFCRIHRSTIVNLNHVVSLKENPRGKFLVKMQHVSEPLPASRRYVFRLKKLLA